MANATHNDDCPSKKYRPFHPGATCGCKDCDSFRKPPPRVDMAPIGDLGAASKKDVGKVPFHQGLVAYFPRALQGVAMVSEYGARKYGRYGGWSDVPDCVVRYSDAKARHLFAGEIEGLYDEKDSGLAHALQEAWNALARAEKMLQAGTIAVRRGNDIGTDGKPILGTARPL